MNRILITGLNGYVSNSLRKWIDAHSISGDVVELIDLKNSNWKQESFHDVKCVIHTAALVHKNEKKYSLELYREVNTQLTKELAMKSKREGVQQFIFISTMAVYGVEPSCFRTTIIDEHFIPSPKSKYGLSKYEAEQQLKELEDSSFKIAIIRPPLIYGHECPGNYTTLKKLTLKIRIIPKINNKKSMIYIDNLCRLIYEIMVNNISGVFMPQNQEYVTTSTLSLLIAKCNQKQVIYTSLFTPLIYFSSLFIPKLRKAFGNEVYDMALTKKIPVYYNDISFESSVTHTECKEG